MVLWNLLLIVFAAGAVGGIVNALLSDNGFILPRPETVGQGRIIRPGFIGNVVLGGVAACISWGLYGAFASAYVAGGPSPTGEGASQALGLTLSALVGAVLVGVGGARWLTNEVDKTLLRSAAGEAAASEASPNKAMRIMTATPAGALRIAKE